VLRQGREMNIETNKKNYRILRFQQRIHILNFG